MQRIIHSYRNAYTGLARATWLLSIVMLINRSGTMVIAFMTLYMTQKLGYSIASAGWVMACFGLGSVCGGLIGGRLVDRFGFYYIQIVTLIGGGFGFLLLGQMRALPAICVSAFVLSMINDAFRPANSAAVAHYSKPENRTRSFSLNRLAINIGWAVGSAVGGFLASHNYELLFWVDGFTNISAALLLWLLLAPSKNEATIQQKPRNDVPAPISAYQDKPYLIFFGLCCAYGFCFFQIFTTMPVFYRQSLHLNERIIGAVMAMNGIIIAVTEMVLVHYLEGKRPVLQMIAIGTLVVGTSFLIFNVISVPLLVALLSTVLATIGEMLSMPFMNTYWLSRSNDRNRGQYAGLYSASWSIAQVAGPATGALIADTAGFNALWWVIGGVCILTAAGYNLLQKAEVTA